MLVAESCACVARYEPSIRALPVCRASDMAEFIRLWGAVNHVTGIDAKLFIAVNHDPNAPIFNYCDYGIVGDMDDICLAMLSALE